MFANSVSLNESAEVVSELLHTVSLLLIRLSLFLYNYSDFVSGLESILFSFTYVSNIYRI